ncbi:AMP-binding protein [Streptomyces sp. AM 2-1-1]|uniref:AMP-binding protein n=1 Tax=Streptomyces sp. AM 2-1-1 TaxID=3028709 RepID=UPI0023B8C11F|nr:AMP-binding protein [Streptomyces sp. AM 2-1-1]WEH38089.1 AMP-binding protein [Streptomyces sp. AM 2-1-1]
MTITRLDYNQDRAAYSHGRLIYCLAIRIDACHDPGQRASEGRLRVRGARLALGYYKRADAFDAEMNAEGWFATGDVAREDVRGGIRLLGRAKDAILRDGIVVLMAELEAIIARHPR